MPSGLEVCTCCFGNIYYHLRIVPKQLRKAITLCMTYSDMDGAKKQPVSYIKRFLIQPERLWYVDLQKLKYNQQLLHCTWDFCVY